MRNIHILPTEIPGRFSLKSNGEYCLSYYSYPDSPNFKNQNTYITSDEEIKDGDWYIYLGQINKRTRKNLKAEYPFPNYQKIILTTDQDLIKDGVQEIDDDFLEWFVENPNCEEVEVEKYFHEVGDTYDYEIIIPKEEYIFPDIKCKCIMFEPNSFTGMCKNCGFPPKEEPKTMLESLQEYLKNTPKEKVLEDWNEFQHLDNEGITVKEFLENQKQTDEKGRPLTYWGGLKEHKQETFLNEKCFKCGRNQYSSRKPFCTDDFCNKDFYQKPKQETLEQACSRIRKELDYSEFDYTSFKLGVKWQQEQDKNMYSEEEVHNIIESYQNNVENNPVHITYDKWFEQFKKK